MKGVNFLWNLLKLFKDYDEMLDLCDAFEDKLRSTENNFFKKNENTW